MKNFNNNQNQERVEVMALFGYEMTPCQPLSFKRRGGAEPVEVTELLEAKVSFQGGRTKHIFDVTAKRERFRLVFDSANLYWYLSPAE